MLILSVALLLVWQWRPATSAIFPDRTDPSTTAMFYQPLLDRLGPTAGRIEIPFTRAHWETVFVADRVALARGWERQLDHKYDQLLYEPTLSASDYRAWLVDNAVQYVALPNVPLDFSSQREADLLRSGVAGLQQIWHSRYWTVWAVTGTRHLVEGPAHLTHMDTNTFELAATGVGAITIRTHYSPRWTVTGPGCVRSTPAGWTQIVASAPGRLALRQRLTLKSTPCPDVPADAT